MNNEKLEIAARKLCALRGIDPDELVTHGADPDPDGYCPAIAIKSKRWSRVAREIRKQLEITEAIEYANEI